MVLSKAPFVLMNFTFVGMLCFTAYFMDFFQLLVDGYLNRKKSGSILSHQKNTPNALRTCAIFSGQVAWR